MAKGYRPIDRDQVFLLPPNLRDWLPTGHRVWFVLDIVNQLDLSALHAVSKRGGVGRAGYHPDLLVAVLIYAYMHGQLSSRGIERACTSDVAYMVACGRDVPDHTVIARFRQVHEAALKDLFGQVLVICAKAGMGRFGVVAIDGTKIGANASMGSNRKFSRLKEKAAEVLARSAAVDAAEDARHGAKGTGLDLLPLWTDPQVRPDLIDDALTEIAEEDDDLTDPHPDNAADDTDSGSGSGQRTSAAAPGKPSTEVALAPSTEVALAPSTEVALAPSTEVALAPSTEVALLAARSSAEVVPAALSARERRFAADKDARILAAFASIAAQEAARDAVVREPRVAKAQARVARGQARVAKVRAELLAKEQAQALRIANGGQRFRQVPVEDNSVMVTAKTKLLKAEQNLVTAQASGRRPALQIDPMGNLTDPDSRKMRRTGGGYMQAYNGQLAVTDDHLILVTKISQSPNDQSSGIPMINATVEAIEKLTAATGLARIALGTLLLDAGYCSGDILTAPGPDRLISTGQSRELNNAADTPAPTRFSGKPSVIDKMTKRLAEPDNAVLYKRRSATVEPVNGHIKDGRGLRQFSRRGLAAVESELSIAAWVTNLSRLYQHLHPAPAT